MVTKEVWSMSETPLPQIASAMPPSADTLEERADAGELRPRRRSHSGANRPVSAFSPGPTAVRSEATARAELSVEDLAFVAALRAAGIALELTETELARVAQHVQSSEPAARRLDLLAAYYSAGEDALLAQRRQATDRWFLFQAADALDASQLVGRLLHVVPELPGATLERVGGAAGTLVLRADDDVCALEDEREEEGVATVSVCDLVRSINVLLDRRSVRARLVGLLGDGTREAYLALPSVTAAIALSSADYLAAPDAETLLDLTGW